MPPPRPFRCKYTIYLWKFYHVEVDMCQDKTKL